MALARFARTTDLPLYNQPSDTDLYHDNKRRYITHTEEINLSLCTWNKEAASMTGYSSTDVAPESGDGARVVDGAKASTMRCAVDLGHRDPLSLPWKKNVGRKGNYFRINYSLDPEVREGRCFLLPSNGFLLPSNGTRAPSIGGRHTRSASEACRLKPMNSKSCLQINNLRRGKWLFIPVNSISD